MQFDADIAHHHPALELFHKPLGAQQGMIRIGHANFLPARAMG